MDFGFMFGGTNDNLNEVLAVDPQLVPGIKLFLGSSTGNMLVDNHEVLRDIFSNTKLPISVHCEDEQTIQYNLSVFIEKYGEYISNLEILCSGNCEEINNLKDLASE